ncbi:hypothetical protein R9C00_05930 [Flammeovirgaceae bacterium SG7u.111]|nr:hypothetical protein [Flammeovirgaceae bacterium SG7u.132]WPO36980.1 hypothetical protein R9C00_05930 [Flammeovirgaceae bacterium SG7u.111]
MSIRIKERLTLTLLITLMSSLFWSCSEDPSEEKESCTDVSKYVFEEQDGLVVIEIENTEIGEGWVKKTDVAGFTGTSYLQWEGGNQNNSPGKGLMKFNVNITTPGTYRFQWRSRINEGDSPSESNDAWLRLADATDFYGLKNESIVYPKDTGKTPNPKGSSKEGWFKVYQNKLGEWDWKAKTSDHDAHDIFATFEKAGRYTIEISGRSNGFAIDRIVLYLDTVESSVATDTDQAASSVFCQ